MGYTLKIGNAVIATYDDSISIEVESVENNDAPAFGEPTDHTNSRWPSYSSWGNFCEALDLEEVMFGDDNYFYVGDEQYTPLIDEHPGHTRIMEVHYTFVESKVKEYKEKNPDNFAKYDENDPLADGNLCRAEWLLYWMRWALDNCEAPVFTNS